MGNGDFLRRELHLDTEMATNTLDNNNAYGELLSDPSTWIFSSKRLESSPTTRPNSPSNSSTSKSPYAHHRRKAIASSEELQRQLSLSDMSEPGLMEDYSNNSWTGSEDSLVELVDIKSSDASPRVPYYDDWNLWFPADATSQVTLPARDSNLSSRHRNFGSPNLSQLDMPSMKDLPAKNAKPQPGFLKKQQSCIAFPQIKQQTTTYYRSALSSSDSLHKSWSAEQKAKRPQLRDRANTTPPNPVVPTHSTSLSLCTTLTNSVSPRSTTDYSRSSDEHLYMRSTPSTPFDTSFSSTLSASTTSTQADNFYDQEEQALTNYISSQSYFFHDDDDNEKEKTWLETQRAKFHRSTHGLYRNPSIPLLSDPPRLTPSQQFHHHNSDSTSSLTLLAQKTKSSSSSIKPKKKKASFGKQAKELFTFTLTSRKSSAKMSLSEQFRADERAATPLPSPPFTAPPLVMVQKRPEKTEECKTCPKCHWSSLQKDGVANAMVTCHCRADLCYGCLRDWDFCEGLCCVRPS